MKRYISYFAVLLAVLLGAACSKDDSAAGSDNRTGVMAMTVSTRQTADTGEYDPLQHQTVYIYNDEGGLLRKYTSKEALPERLELLAGTYRVAVEAGEEAPADFTKRLYKGEETFTVKPGETTNVAVVCQIVNTVVEVKFDDSILQNLAPGYSVWIANGGSSEVATTYRLEGLVPVTADDYDLWANTVTLRVVSFTPGTTVQFGLRSSGGEWQPMAGTSQGNDFITATYAPQWEEKTTADWSTPATVLPYSRLKKGTGISAGNTYDYNATVGSKELSGRFTADEGAPMTDGSLESWRSAQQFPGSGTNYTFWGSGYNPFAKELCTRDEAMPGRVGTYCAKLSATYNTLAKVPAPGNLFTGDFAIQVLGGMGGNVSFGKKFAYNARPRAVRFKYHATIGEVNYNLHGGKIPVGEMDKARIFVCIVDWTAQQKVFAGTKAPTGTWDPETQTEAANGPIIGYASKFIEETTQGDEMVEVILPINYYQDTAAAPDGKYNIVVSCSTSAYGDYMDACTTNVMYVDDFEWVY